ncbi:LacI family DNA-binding transcriptional regulator [Cellulosilyticum sp. I15G10I2]|uniref:LacI family DNA-binding transcriptional regulator n=1 Tax=Cellulosilyticum sp. I15G10I2 TaxID=1892843 RepID=UPI002E8E59F9|nr:substrate-binding domain-containing protein [Cellulosilyticum sp. I15G10I2]
MTAVNLAKNNSNIIGFVMNSNENIYDNAIQDFFTGELLGGLEKRIHGRGYYIMIYISKHVEEVTKFVSSWNVDGLVALGFSYENAQVLREVYKKPLIFIDGYFGDDGNAYTNVGIEDYRGAYEMTSHLIANGHKRIGFFSDNYIGGDYERYRGFVNAIRDAGLAPEAGEKFVLENGTAGLEPCMQHFVEGHSKISAMFFCADYYAVTAMNYLMDHGIRIPEDVSVAGYDDATVASIIRPKLTTVRQNTTHKAYAAIDKLLKLIENPDEKAENIVMPVELRIRDSVKNINLVQ